MGYRNAESAAVRLRDSAMPFIVETIVTTQDESGRVNFAPMGVEWGDEVVVLKPYQDTQTFRNLTITRQAVVNLTDRVDFFAVAAISDPEFPWHPARVVQGAVLDDACSWRELEVVDIDVREPRARVTGRVVYAGFRREFIGYNRAQAAIIEAAILATRVRFLPMDDILTEWKRLRVIVEKTGGPREHAAMDLLTEYVHRAAATLASSGQAT